MPRTYTTEELQERYEKLPDALKDAIFSTEVAEKIFATGKKNGLTVEKIGFLAEETGRVILGITRPNEFVSLLAERLGAMTDATQKIASDINHQIFFPLREILKTTHQVDVGEAAIQRPADAIDLRAMGRPSPAPSPAPTTPIGTAKVPPIDLRAKQSDQARQPLVDIGDIAIPPRSLGFLTREEAEKVVTEKKIMPPAPPPAPHTLQKTPQSESLGVSVSNLETDTPSIRAEEPKASTANPQVFPQDKKMFSPVIPSGSPHVFPQQAPQSKIPTIDLRKDKGISLNFIPPPPTPPRQTLHAPATSLPPPSPAPPPIATPAAPAIRQEAPPSPAPSKIPPIDLRAQPTKPSATIKTKPWSGTDPYRESVE